MIVVSKIELQGRTGVGVVKRKAEKGAVGKGEVGYEKARGQDRERKKSLFRIRCAAQSNDVSQRGLFLSTSASH